MMGDESVRGPATTGAEGPGSSAARQADPWHPKEFTLSVRRWDLMRRSLGPSLRVECGQLGNSLMADGGR